jgi:hypothetical protein
VVRLLETGLALPVELSLHMTVGEHCQHRHRYEGAAYEENEESAPELAPQRCRRKGHIQARA